MSSQQSGYLTNWLGVSGTTVSERGKTTYKPGEPDFDSGKTGDPLWLGVSGTTVSQRCKTMYKSSEPASTARNTGDPIRLVGIQRVKCRMKCFYETWSHGPQDQNFDGIRRNIYLQISDFGSWTQGAKFDTEVSDHSTGIKSWCQFGRLASRLDASLVEWSDTYVLDDFRWDGAESWGSKSNVSYYKCMNKIAGLV